MKTNTLFALVLLISSTAFSNGVAVIDAHNRVYLRLDSSFVAVNVEGQIATTTTIQYFTNTTSATTIKYGFPLSEQASATKLRWFVAGEWHSASVAGAKQDTSLPGGGGTPDPDLMTYLGKTPLYFSVPDTIHTDSILAVELTYVELLPYAFGSVKYVYPSDYHLIQSNAIVMQELLFHLASPRTIDSIEVLSAHPVASVTNSGTTADVHILLHEQQITQNYTIHYALSATQLGLFAYSSSFPHEQVPDSLGVGFLTFIAEPNPDATTSTMSKVFTLILDRSGSMYGTKMVQARDAASFVVNNLNEGDRFNLIDFDDVITSFRPEHVLFTPQTRDSALAYIASLEARNNTSISGAFAMAIPQFTSASDSTANIVIFFTDGQPTAGITDMNQLVGYVDTLVQRSEKKIFLFSFGIGGDANRQLLTLMSSHNRGFAEFLGNDELYLRITDFYLSIRNPVLLDSHISFSPPVVSEIYPDSLPNLYQGNQMIVSARYQEAAPTEITLSGTAFGKPVGYTYDLQLADTVNPTYQFLQKIWAKRKIESLLIRYYLLNSVSEEAIALKNQIIAISQAYGVISEFTSFTSQATGVEKGDARPTAPVSDFELLGNYPNPFNPSTTITFRVNRDYAGIVELRIYNILGQIVRTLRLTVHGRGIYKAVWDGLSESQAPLSSGVYFYGIEIGNTVLVGKMTLMK